MVSPMLSDRPICSISVSRAWWILVVKDRNFTSSLPPLALERQVNFWCFGDSGCITNGSEMTKNSVPIVFCKVCFALCAYWVSMIPMKPKTLQLSFCNSGPHSPHSIQGFVRTGSVIRHDPGPTTQLSTTPVLQGPHLRYTWDRSHPRL